MAKKTLPTYTRNEIVEMWGAQRGKLILSLMRKEQYSYAEAVTWSRRSMKRYGTYYVK